MKFSRIPIRFSRRVITVAASLGAASALAMGAAGAATSSPEVHASGSISGAPRVFHFAQSPNIAGCLRNAGGTFAIFPHKENDTMVVSVHGLPANTEFDLFVTQRPTPPDVGLSWYQTDIDTYCDNRGGQGWPPSAIIKQPIRTAAERPGRVVRFRIISSLHCRD